MINFIKQAVESVEGIKSFLFNTDYRNNFDLQNVEFPCCVLTPIMRTNYDLNNIIRESAELQLSVVDLAPYEYTGDDLYAINKRCSDLALQVIANLQVKSKLDKELTFEFILPSGDELISGVMCNLTATMKQGSCIGAPSYVEIVVQPIKKESITSNGKHIISADKGFNAMREVEVDVQIGEFTTEEKSVDITSNGEVEILPTNADAMTKVIANVQVPLPPLEKKQVTITKAKTTETITPDAEYGLSRVEVSTDIPLESKQVTINENGTTTIEASEGFEGLSSVEVTTDINNLQGLDFSSIYDQEQADELNQYYKDGIEYAEEIKKDWLDTKDKDSFFRFDLNLIYLPKIPFYMTTTAKDIFRNSGLQKVEDDYLEMLNVTALSNFASNSPLRKVIINAPKLNAATNLFANMSQLKHVEIISSIENIYTFANITYSSYNLVTFKVKGWKQGAMSLNNSSKLSAESIHYIIQNAVNAADGATARTLTFHTTARKNWQNSEYYVQDLAVLEDKGITIA